MPYAGSYVWKIRQKIGHDLLLAPTVDVVPVRDDGALLMVFNKGYGHWVFPGGFIEENQTAEEAAVQELLEEGGLETTTDDLVPFAYQSCNSARYKNGDMTQTFVQTYLTRNWRDLGKILDKDEIAERKWFMPNELRTMDLNKRMTMIFKAYETFLETGKYQLINVKKETE
jgi:8-oxo-dGTP diphosphatase